MKLLIHVASLLTVSSSTSITKNMIDGYFSDNSLKNGAIILQGPHHDALKFAITCWTSPIKYFQRDQIKVQRQDSGISASN